MSKPFNVVVWGASGFTGQLVCEHIAKDYKHQVKWALAGRNAQKLEKIRAELAERYGSEIADTPILLGSLDDAASLDTIAQQTDVIISTAGSPFALHGTPVVAAAVRQSTHYVDITGEIPWVKRLVKEYHEEAAAKNVRIVPCCGYDSVPSDIGALLVVDHIRNKLHKEPASVTTAVWDARGGVSGGTIATGMYQVSEAAKSKDTGLDATSTYALIPPGATVGKDTDIWRPRFDAALGSWLAPFIMQVCNTRVVQRSNYLLNWGGPGFSYSEGQRTSGWASATALAAAVVSTGAVLSQVWLHPLLKRVLPAPGQGPDRDFIMTKGRFTHRVVGVTKEEGGAVPDVVVAELGDPKRDPGYWGTSRMVLEAALTLALQRDELDKDSGVLHGGVLTPASALGATYMDRLRAAGLKFEVKEVKKLESK